MSYTRRRARHEEPRGQSLASQLAQPSKRADFLANTNQLRDAEALRAMDSGEAKDYALPLYRANYNARMADSLNLEREQLKREAK